MSAGGETRSAEIETRSAGEIDSAGGEAIFDGGEICFELVADSPIDETVIRFEGEMNSSIGDTLFSRLNGETSSDSIPRVDETG